MKHPFKMILGFLTVTLLSGWFLLSPAQGHAQTRDSTKKYHVFLEVYLFAPSMSGTTGVGKLPNTFICIPFSEIFSDLKMAAMVYAEVHNDRYAFTSDLFYASLQQDASLKNGVLAGTASLKQFMWELAALYKVQPWLEFGVGARINNINAGLNINYTGPLGGTQAGSGSMSQTWVDPIVITRLKGVLSNKWMLQLRADIGGFGVGSQLAWQLQPDIYFRASRLLEIGLGYRVLSMNYSTGTKGTSNWFLYDIEEYGPQIRIGFNL